MEHISLYIKKVIRVLLSVHEKELKEACSGHCMKITGLALEDLKYLHAEVVKIVPQLKVLIVGEDTNGDDRFVTATKLIEYRNQNAQPLLILIPLESRTAAEDSYGNTTFKEISLNGIEKALLKNLIESLPASIKFTVVNEIFGFLDSNGISDAQKVSYLIDLEGNNISDKSVGNSIYHLGLIPDSSLLDNPKLIRMRLGKNIDSLRKLANHAIPVSDRISSLALQRGSLQSDIAAMLKAERSVKTTAGIAAVINEKYHNLNFNRWVFPDLQFKSIKLVVNKLFRSASLEESNGKFIYHSNGKKGNLKLRVTTSPSPKEIAELKYFKVLLMAPNGEGSGEVIHELKKQPKTATNQPPRVTTVVLDPNIIEEGIYFIRVVAEDETGTILNDDDDFKDREIQDAWEKEQSLKGENASKDDFAYKFTSDSDDFDFVVEDEVEDTAGSNRNDIRKDKVNTVLQAFMNYNIGLLKKNESGSFIPIPDEDSNVWVDDNDKNKVSTYHVKFDSFNNYQINVPSKIRQIENTILEWSGVLARHTFVLDKNSTDGLPIVNSVELPIKKHFPIHLQELRKNLFEKIKNSNEAGNGIFETFDFYNHIKLIKQYVDEFSAWLSSLRSKITTEEISGESVNQVILDAQAIDTVTILATLPNNDPLEFKLISPLHPLMLSWFVNFYDLFKSWYDKSTNDRNHVPEWIKDLEELLFERLTPSSVPLVLRSEINLKEFHHVGSLMYGWALYLEPETRDSSIKVTSSSEQVKSHIRDLMHIKSHQVWENDVNSKIIIRHLKHYIAQHPYVDKVIINIFNAGDAAVFANAFIELENDREFQNITYVVRLFKGQENLEKPGFAFEQLLNPVNNISEAAEAFSQQAVNRLHPKLRYSVNGIQEYFVEPEKFTSHLSFLLNPFPLKTELVKSSDTVPPLFVNDLVLEKTTSIAGVGSGISWRRFIPVANSPVSASCILLNCIQNFTAASLSTKLETKSVPATVLELRDKDYVLLSNLHDHSDWVITIDHNIGPDVFDTPSSEGDKQVPCLLDYVPGGDAFGVSSYLTTRPTSEVYGLLAPHFDEYNLLLSEKDQKKKILTVLEDLRAVSSSIVLQLNSTSNKSFEVIGTAFTKRLLEKKGVLENGFIVPIDLHQELFRDLPSESQSRADTLVVHIHPESNEIELTIVEIKCRKSLNDQQLIELKDKICDQIDNTVEALRYHFDRSYNPSIDRLDRDIKTFDLKGLLSFYLEKSLRYNYMNQEVYVSSKAFLDNIRSDVDLCFNKMGVIYNFSAAKKHVKEVGLNEVTFFILGQGLIGQILDEHSDLNTIRLETEEFSQEFKAAISRRVRSLPKSTEEIKPQPIDKPKPIIDTPNTPLSSLIKATETVSPQPVIVEAPTQEKQPITSVNPAYEVGATVLSEPREGSDPSPSVGDFTPPAFDIIIGKTSDSPQYGLLGKTVHGKKVALDLSETSTVSLFGVQGGGKSYTIGSLTEMAIKQFSNVNQLPSPLAGVIFHFSESMDYEPEFTSMVYSNNKKFEMDKLSQEFGAKPDKLEDVVILTPKDKVDERRIDYPSIDVFPIAFNSKELSVQDWLFLLGATGNDSTYVKQLKAIMKEKRKCLTLENIQHSVEDSLLLSNSQKQLAKQRLSFAEEYIDDSFTLRDVLKPGRLVLVDLRDEFIEKDEALGIFVIMLNVFSAVTESNGKSFNKFIVFDEAHKYMDDKDLTASIVTAIREMRHKGVSIVIASQDPLSLPNDIIALSTSVILHKFNSPLWLKHIKKSITQLESLTSNDLSSLNPGECFLWATKSNNKSITQQPVKLFTRPRVTLHGGSTKKAHE